jgi:predicted DNA-binding transcriptional regulator AlpA
MSAVPERYLRIDELAQVMGVGETTIKRWRAEGMPSETWGMKRTRRYLASKCMAWARARAAGNLRCADNHDPRPDRAGGQPKE